MVGILAATAVAHGATALGKAILKKSATDARDRVAGNLVTKAGRMMKEGQSIRSLADYARPARVEPLVIVEDGLRDNPAMGDIMKGVSSIFIGYYLQAAVFQGTKIGSIEPLKVFDSLNPERGRVSGSDLVWSKESYEEGLPSFEDYTKQDMTPGLVVSVEAAGALAAPGATAGTSNPAAKPDKPEKPKPGYDGNHTAVSDADIGKYYEIPNLVVGKMVNVELRDGEQSAKFPVMIRLTPTAVKKGVITHIFTSSSKDNSHKERVHLWRGGQLSFWRDLVFQTDLIDQHRKTLVNDPSNVYDMVSTRRRKNVMAAAQSNKPSMADASNILIITKDTARDIGRALYGKIESVTTRQKFFDTSYLLLLVVVDELHDRVTIYHRGYDKPTEVSFNDIKGTEKNKGPDITEILKMYVMGSTPNLV